MSTVCECEVRCVCICSGVEFDVCVCVCVCVSVCARDMREESSCAHNNSPMGEGEKHAYLSVLLDLLTTNQCETGFTPL